MIADVIFEEKQKIEIFWEKTYQKFWKLYIYNDCDWKGLLFAQILKNLL